jgi:hypothetical protein
METRPDVSVLMPARNVERFIGLAIESVLSETRLAIELVVVNDGSTDRTGDIVDTYAGRDFRVVSLRRVDRPGEECSSQNRWYAPHHGRGRVPEALNLGLRFCAGRYIARLDADDIASSDRFLQQWSFMESHPEVGLLGSSAIRIDEHGQDFAPYHHQPLCHDEIVARLRTFVPFAPHSSWLVRREVFEILDGYDRFGCRAEDLDLMLRMTEISGLRFAFIDRPLIRLRMHERGVSYTGSSRPVAYAIAALVRHRLRLTGRASALVDQWRPEIFEAVESEIARQGLDRELAAYHALRLAYIALKTGRWANAAMEVARAVVRSPAIAMDYRAIRQRKVDVADAVVSRFERL